MKALFALSFTLALFSSACRHTSSGASGTLSEAAAVDCSKIESMMCLSQYEPTSCQYARQVFKGTNGCEARRLVQMYACKNNLKYDESQVNCAATDENEAPALGSSEEVKDCSQQRGICTREYNPQSCTAKGISAKGTNPCEARNALRVALCEQGKTADDSEISCQSPASETSKNCSEQRTICTREYNPQTCSAEGLKASGSNPCEARNALRIALCEQGLTALDSAMSCEADTGGGRK